MTYSSKMVLIPSEAYTTPMARNPVETQLSRVDSQMEAIFNNSRLAPDEKFLKYQDVFRRHQELEEEKKKPIELKLKMDAGNERQPELPDYLLNSFRDKGMRSQAELLVKHLARNTGTIQWNNNYELLDTKGNTIPGSNMVDLVIDFTRNRSKVSPALGAEQFAQLLQQTHIPRAAVKNVRRLDINSYTPMAAGTSEERTPRRVVTGKVQKTDHFVRRSVRKQRSTGKQTGFGVIYW